jgi:uncharacterized protein
MADAHGAPAAIDPRSVDVFEFARNGLSAAGEVQLADLPRMLAEVPADAPERDAVLRWRLNGETRAEMAEVGAGVGGGAGAEVVRPYLRLTLDGAVWLECQRCLGPYRQAVDVTVEYRVAASDEEADAYPLDEDELEVVVGSHRFDLVGLIDEELLLSMPLVPKHEVCPETHESLVAGTDTEASAGTADRPAQAAGAPADESARPHPFAGLAALKGKDKK